MSSSEIRPLHIFGLVATFALSGCLQPVYAPSDGRDVQAELAAISITPIEDRLGHYLTTELEFAFKGGGSVGPPRYKLMIAVRERVQAPLIDTITGRASAGTVMVDADYKLVSLAGGEPLANGVAFTMATYDRSGQRFANIRAARDAEIRDAKALADQIRTRIAAAFASRR
jgi:LPS-assembly lipoprotein